MDLVIDFNDCPREQIDAQEMKIKHRVLDHAVGLGPFVLAFVDSLWIEGVQSLGDRAARLMALATRYGSERLDAACRRALFYRELNYPTLEKILRQHLENLPLNPYADVEGQLSLFPMDLLEECGV
jgi:hypothetical protein